MKKLFCLLLVTGALAFCPRAHPDSISGAIAVAGLNDVSFNSTGISFSNAGIALAQGSGGSLGSVLGSATLNGFSFTNAPGNVLFTVQSWTGQVVSFTVSGIEESVVNGILTISGYGILNETGYQSTPAFFNLSASMSSSPNGWLSSSLEITSVVTPEPASLILLGTGLLMIALLVFRKGKASHRLTHT